jgi:hypothetical protein
MTEQLPKDTQLSPAEIRNALGEAYVMCNQCGARLWSTEGYEDFGITCPYPKGPKGECQPTRKRS